MVLYTIDTVGDNTFETAAAFEFDASCVRTYAEVVLLFVLVLVMIFQFEATLLILLWTVQQFLVVIVML